MLHHSNSFNTSLTLTGSGSLQQALPLDVDSFETPDKVSKAPFYSKFIPINLNTCGRFHETIRDTLCGASIHSYSHGIEHVSSNNSRSHLLRSLAENGVATGSANVEFKSLSDFEKMSLLEYADCATQSYSPHLSEQDTLYPQPRIMDLDQDLETQLKHSYSHLTNAANKLEYLQHAYQSPEFKDFSLKCIEPFLNQQGFRLHSKGNMIFSKDGVAARLFFRRDRPKDEILIAFPGLGAQGLDKAQQRKRIDTIWENFLPLKQENLYDQALLMTQTLSESLKTAWARHYDSDVSITVTGHSLGGGFAMVAANCELVDQSVAFQAYAPVAYKVSARAAQKIVDVNIKNDEMIPSFLYLRGSTRKVTCDQSQVFPKKMFTVHAHFFPQLMSNFA